MESLQQSQTPDLQTLRADALQAGGIDPASLRFRIVEYEKASGELLGVPGYDLAFGDAVATTMALISANEYSHYCLEPVGFVQ